MEEKTSPRSIVSQHYPYDYLNYDVEDQAQGRLSSDSTSTITSGSTSTTSTFTMTEITTRKPTWGEILELPMLYLKTGFAITRWRSIPLPPYERLPQRPSPPSPSGARTRKFERGFGFPVGALSSSIPRRYYKPKLLCVCICATLFSSLLYGWYLSTGVGGPDEVQLKSGMSLLRGSVPVSVYRSPPSLGASEEGELSSAIVGDNGEGGVPFTVEKGPDSKTGGGADDPPLYPEYFTYEDTLIQHHRSSSPASSGPPPHKYLQRRYINFANHNVLLGFNNHLEEYLLNAHLAFLLNRSFVMHPYTWNPEWESEPVSVWNGRKIPSRVPESVILGGWVGGAVRHAAVEEDLTPVSQGHYDSVCPLSDRVYVNAQEVMDSFLSDYIAYPDMYVEGKRVREGDGMQLLGAWVERLGSREDVKNARCVEVQRGSGHVFDFWLFGSPRLHSLWSSLVQSPVLQHWSFSPLIYGAFQRNLVNRQILGASVKNAAQLVDGESLRNGMRKGVVLDGIEYDEFGYPQYPSGYAYPSIHTPGVPSRSLNSSSTYPFTQRIGPPVWPYPRTPSTPLLPILTLHLRRGDFEEHCTNLAEWGSEFMGFVSFEEYAERDGFVSPGVDGSVDEKDGGIFDGDEDTRTSVVTGVGSVHVNVGSSTMETTSWFRGHRFSDTDPRTVSSLDAKKRVVVGRHCYPDTKQIVKRVRQVVNDWVGGRYIRFLETWEANQALAASTVMTRNEKGEAEYEQEYERALAEWKNDTLERLKAVYVMTNGDQKWAGEVREALREGIGGSWEFKVNADVEVNLAPPSEKIEAEGSPAPGRVRGDGSLGKRVLEWNVDEWPWDVDSASSGIIITTARDLELRKEEKYVAQAVDMYIGQRSEVFIGNGFSSMTANVVMLRKKDGLDSVQTRFW